MKATLMYAAGDVRIADVPDAAIVEPTDAVIRVTRACICGSDLWPYASMERSDAGRPMGHEAIGVVEDVGSQVARIRKGDVVVMPFAHSDGTCAFCREGLTTACVHVGFFGSNGTSGAHRRRARARPGVPRRAAARRARGPHRARPRVRPHRRPRRRPRRLPRDGRPRGDQGHGRAVSVDRKEAFVTGATSGIGRATALASTIGYALVVDGGRTA